MAWGIAAAAAASYLANQESDSGQPATAEDITPPEFRRLRDPISTALQDFIGQGGGATFGGDFSAGMTNQEQQLLSQIGQRAQPSQMSQDAQSLLSSTIQGDFMSPESNPFLQANIEAAQRPVVQQFEDVTMPRLRSVFTEHGQRIQPGGSSPFDRAAAISNRGLVQELGDISSSIAGQNFQAERARQLQAAELAPQMDRTQLESMMDALETSALPRLIEQRGIELGLDEFQRQRSALLQALQTAGQMSSPQPITFEGTAGQPSPFASGVNAFTNAYLGQRGEDAAAD